MLFRSRESFVPDAKKAVAYMDGCIGLGRGRVLSDPRSFAKLVQLAQIKATDRILDVGCASGYSTAVLAQLGAEVFGLEQDRELAAIARDTLRSLGCKNTTVVEGALFDGAATCAPFDVIFCNGALATAPKMLVSQLADGGRLAAIIAGGVTGTACLYVRHQGVVSERTAFNAQLPVLPGFEKRGEFAL